MMTPSVRSRRSTPPLSSIAAALVAAFALGACGGDSDSDAGGGGGDGAGVPVDGDTGGAGSAVDQLGADDGDAEAAFPGDVARYGVVTVGDEGGEASDAVAGFFALSAGVSAEAFSGALDPDAAECRVVPAGGDIGFEAVSAGFLPSPAGVGASSIAAGETLGLRSATGGSWAELEPMSIGGTLLYDAASALPDGPVPDDLVADVPGDGEAFPAFVGAALPAVEPLVGFDDGEGDTIGPDARFAWQAGTVPGAKIRLTYVTNAGFFADDGGVTLTCTVPDTGEFTLPEATREALGEDFEGAAFVVSRVAIDTVAEGDALLVLVRESAPEG